MIEHLPNFMLQCSHPVFHDSETVTMIELVGHLGGKINELITEYNKLENNVKTRVEEYISSSERDHEAFKVGIRQEFQDFIDTVELKIMEQDANISNILKSMDEKMEVFKNETNGALDEQSNKINEVYNYLVTNLATTIDQMLQDNEIAVGVSYNEETEELTLVASNN